MGLKPRRKPESVKPKWYVDPDSGRRAGPQKATTSYLISPVNGQPCAFVPHPHMPGLYLKVDVAVVLNACGVCGAEKGEPCISTRGHYTSGRHVDRCLMSRDKRKSLKRDKAYLVCKDSYIVSLDNVLPAIP